MYMHDADYMDAVCPSVTRRYCVETAKQTFSASCSHIIVVFEPNLMAIFRQGLRERRRRNSDRVPLDGGS